MVLFSMGISLAKHPLCNRLMVLNCYFLLFPCFTITGENFKCMPVLFLRLLRTSAPMKCSSWPFPCIGDARRWLYRLAEINREYFTALFFDGYAVRSLRRPCQ